MAIADRLNKLRTDIEDTYQAINNLGGTIPSDKNTNNIPEAIESIYSKLPKVSGTGSSISLTPTLKGRLGSVLKGNTLQDGEPTPDTPVEIQSATGLQNITVCGKNLFDKNSAEVGKFVNASGVIASDNSALVSDFIRITPNINYYISGRTSWNSIGLYNSNKTFLERINLNYTNGILNITNSNCAYIRINASSDNFNTLQLEVGTTATEYEAYQSQTKELNLDTIKLNKIGNYQDYITGSPNNWSIVRKIGEKTLNGTENYSDVSVRTNTIRCLYSLQGANYTAKMTDLSFNNSVYSQDKVGQMLENNYLVLSYPVSVVGNTINSLKTWLSNNNSLIIYRLLEETTETITNTELISQLNEIYYLQSYNGTTNITITSADLELIMTASAIKGEE